jgi:hypothetical protein
VATIHWGSAGLLLVTSAAIMGSPGPATISLTAADSAFGVRWSFAYLIVISAAYILWLAYHDWWGAQWWTHDRLISGLAAPASL